MNKGNKGNKGNNRVYIMHFCLVYVIECLRRMNDTSYVHIIITIGMNVVDNLNSV